MAVQVAEALSKTKGAEFNASVVLGLLTPLLVVHSLPPQLFQDFMVCIQSVLKRIEQWRLHSGQTGGDAALAGSAAGGSVTWDTAASTSSTAAAASVPAATGGLGLGSVSKAEGALDDWGAFLGPDSPVAAVRTSASSSQASLQSLGATSGTAAKPGLGRSPMGRLGDASRAHESSATSLSQARPPGGLAAPTEEVRGSSNGAAAALGASRIDPVVLGGGGLRGASSGGVPQGSGPMKNDPFAELCMAQPAPKLAGPKSANPKAAPGTVPAAVAATNGSKVNTGEWGDWQPFS
jgi:hypothetical protein